MKTPIFTLILTSTILSGCSNQSSISLSQEEEKLVGKYYYIVSEDEKDTNDISKTTMAIEMYPEYHKDKTSETNGTFMLMLYPDKKNTKTIKLEWKFKSEGKWEINEGYLNEKINPSSVTLNLIKNNVENENYDEFIKEYTSIATLKIKNYFNTTNDNRCKIITIDNNKLIVEDQDGENIQMSKID